MSDKNLQVFIVSNDTRLFAIENAPKNKLLYYKLENDHIYARSRISKDEQIIDNEIKLYDYKYGRVIGDLSQEDFIEYIKTYISAKEPMKQVFYFQLFKKRWKKIKKIHFLSYFLKVIAILNIASNKWKDYMRSMNKKYPTTLFNTKVKDLSIETFGLISKLNNVKFMHSHESI